MPTVFLCLYHGSAARFLLRTDILTTLRQRARVVVLAPNADENYLAAEIGGDDVVIEQHRADLPRPADSRLWMLLYVLRQFVIGGSGGDTTAARYEAFHAELASTRGRVAAVVDVAVRMLRRSRLLRRMLLGVETRLFARDAHRELFDRYRPCLVVATSPGWFFSDALVLREAERRGIPTAAVVLGWDNATSKGYRGADPAHVVVWSERMAREMKEHHDVASRRTFVGGAPHFDAYLQDGRLMERDAVVQALGLDPGRRLIFLAARSPSSADNNLAVAERLARAVQDDEFGEPAQLVVRPHPINFKPGVRRSVDVFEDLARRFDDVQVQVPVVLSEKLYCDLSPDDTLLLMSLVKNADVVVNLFSTTTLEAFIADRPVVLVTSEAGKGESLEEAASHGRRFEDDTHFAPVVASGAAEVAGTLDGMVAAVGRALRDPTRGAPERATVARAECGPLDGRSGARIGEFLLECAGATKTPVSPTRGAPPRAVPM